MTPRKVCVACHEQTEVSYNGPHCSDSVSYSLCPTCREAWAAGMELKEWLDDHKNDEPVDWAWELAFVKEIWRKGQERGK